MHTIGCEHIQLPAVDSTNLYALEVLSKSKPRHGTVISTADQYQGRGQIGNSWFSEPGKNIACSTIIYPVFLEANRQFLLSQVVALAVSDFIANYIPLGVKIKWPNDIYVRDKKIAGILIQNTLGSNYLNASVLGVGINVNQLFFPDNLPHATSLQRENQTEYSIPDLWPVLFESIAYWYQQLEKGNHSILQQTYLERLYQYGEECLYQTTDEVFMGRITNVDKTGKLIVETQHQVRYFDIKEVVFMR